MYPGRNMIRIPPDNPLEIICEVEPASEHPEYSVAVAVINESARHFDNETETYEVMRGRLELTVGNEVVELAEGQTYTIHPGTVHSVRSNSGWVKVTTRPGWTPAGHHLVQD